MNFNEIPEVSIIIPAYNYAHYLPETLVSIGQQSFENFECIVVDDGSADNTREVVRDFSETDPRFCYVYQQNSGQPVARNAGLDRARGRYIQFLDADDKLQKDKLLLQVNYLKTHPGVHVVYGEVFYFRSEHPEVFFLNRWGDGGQAWMPGVSGSGNNLISAYVHQNIFELGCGLFRSGLMKDKQNFDPSLKGVEDYDFCFRLALKQYVFEFLSTSGSAVFMRHHPNSFSKSLSQMYRQEVMMRLRIHPLLIALPFYEGAAANRSRMKTRIRQLQDLFIDEKRNGKIVSLQPGILPWLLATSSLRQNWYFLPRWLKARIESRFLDPGRARPIP